MEGKIAFDLEDKVNLLYDYIYNTNTKNCFSLDKIQLGKIGLDDIKIPLPSNNSDEIDFYNSNKSDVLSGRFKLVHYDTDNHKLLFKKYSNLYPVDVKISLYNNDKVINSFDSPINIDSLFSYLLSHMVTTRKTKHILLPIINIDAKLADIEKYISDDPSYGLIKNALLNNEVIDTCCLQVREHFFKTTSLEEYLKKNVCLYKPLLFQIIHTLATIQNEYPDFRHNDLTLKNIMIYLKKQSNTYTEYTGFRNDKFHVPNSGFDIKITNFENSVIPKFYGLINQKNSNIKFADKNNQYYDLFTFLNDLLEGTTMMSRYSDNNKCDAETKKFLDKIIPPNIRGLDFKNFNKNTIVITPIDALYDSFFNEYRQKPTDNATEETITDHQYIMGKKSIETYMDSDNQSTLGKQQKIKSKHNVMRTHKKNRSSKILDDIDDQVMFTNKRVIKNDDTEMGTETIKNTRINKRMVGGSDKIEQAPYKAEKNTPFVTNDQRETFKKRSAENPIREPPVILEQKIYDTSQKPAPKPQFPPTFIPLYDQEGQIANQMLPYSRVINQPPVQKVYNVSLTNPLAGHTSLNKIYEDVLPGEPYNYTAITLFERTQLIDFLRNSIIENRDGEEMTVAGGKNSLLSYIKVLDVNPYSVNKNPYYDLPRNFLLYRAGYPVRFDDKNKLIGIGKPSMGINIRMYMMSMGDLRCLTINKLINAENFDLWREIKYYDWIREEVISRKVSPNFIAPILYKIDSNSKIDWQKLELIRSKGTPNDTIIQLRENQQKVNKLHNISKDMGLFQQLLPLQFRIQTQNTNVTPKSKQPEPKPEDKEDLTVNSGKTLVLLTEAPTTNIITWSSSVYESYGSVKKMTGTGYHTPEVWNSVLFQLLYACSVLQKKGIYLNNLSLENNVYIKDLYFDHNSIGSWIYKVDDIDFYVPNYGYVLVLDSKYADVSTNTSLLKKDPSADQDFKIYGKIFNNNSNFMMTSIDVLIHQQFKELINPSNFGHTFKIKGGSIPDKSVLDLMNAIWTDNTTNNIKDYILKYFSKYVHNRVGSLLYKSEKDNINLFSRPNFNNKGSLMAWQKRFQEYEWVIYVGDVGDGLRKNIIVRDNTGHKVQSVFASSLYGYPETEQVLPESGQNMKYDEKHIYEIYNLNNI